MAKIDKNLQVLIGVSVVLLALVAVFAVKVQPQIEDLTSASIIQTSRQISQENSLSIDDGSGNVQALEFRMKKGSSAFDLLKKGADKLGLELKVSFYEEMGVFIEAIGDKTNGQENKYWLYYVNGTMPSVAADRQPLEEGDKVEFKFEESPF